MKSTPVSRLMDIRKCPFVGGRREGRGHFRKSGHRGVCMRTWVTEMVGCVHLPERPKRLWWIRTCTGIIMEPPDNCDPRFWSTNCPKKSKRTHSTSMAYLGTRLSQLFVPLGRPLPTRFLVYQEPAEPLGSCPTRPRRDSKRRRRTPRIRDYYFLAIAAA
jgi:hypothetical protein